MLARRMLSAPKLPAVKVMISTLCPSHPTPPWWATTTTTTTHQTPPPHTPRVRRSNGVSVVMPLSNAEAQDLVHLLSYAAAVKKPAALPIARPRKLLGVAKVTVAKALVRVGVGGGGGGVGLFLGSSYLWAVLHGCWPCMAAGVYRHAAGMQQACSMLVPGQLRGRLARPGPACAAHRTSRARAAARLALPGCLQSTSLPLALLYR